MSKIIFLDFDGVVVCLPKEKDKTDESLKSVRALNKDCVARLNKIIEVTGAAVVISSTWRIGTRRRFLQGYLDRAGFVGNFIDVTPGCFDEITNERLERGYEIQSWLDYHPETTSFVVLDDDYDFGPLDKEKWVLVKDGWYNGGLQDHHVEQAIKVLNG